MPIYEEFLFYIWQFKAFNQLGLQTTTGQNLEVLHAGLLNRDAGPDFLAAKIKIGDTEWAGNVEIHVKSSDWLRHNHQLDKAYNNVILHVVYEDDIPAYRQDGSIVPALILKPHIPASVENRYNALKENLNWIPCEKQISTVDELHLESWFLRMLVERLEHKSEQFMQVLGEYQGSWDDAFYVMLARNFGFKTNGLPFEMLARSLPQQLLAKHKGNKRQIEALIFGQAGFLQEVLDDVYHAELRQEYRFLQAKYQLKPIDQYLWKFMRLRPQNFPTLRLSQFAALVIKSSHLFSKILELEDAKQIADLFENLPVSPYWINHYRFGAAAENVSPRLGKSSINNLLLNSVALSLFTYGQYTANHTIQDRAIALITSLPFEQNQITGRFIALGIRKGNSDRSQALLHLKKTYCDLKKCLNCAIGTKIVNPK